MGDDGAVVQFADPVIAYPGVADLSEWEDIIRYVGRGRVPTSDNPFVPQGSVVDITHDGFELVYVRRVPDGQVLDFLSFHAGHWYPSSHGVDFGHDDVYHFTLVPASGSAFQMAEALDVARAVAGPRLPQDPALARAVSEGAETIVRVYRGKRQADAEERYEAEATVLADFGYRPTDRQWAQGQWDRGLFLIAALLVVVLVGVFLLIYLLFVEPDGTLTVTYSLDERLCTASGPPDAPLALEAAPADGDEGERSPSQTLLERLDELDQARRAGAITDEEYRARRQSIWADF